MNKVVINYIVTILIWVAAVVLWVLKGWWYITASLFLLHFVELLTMGLKIGRENGKSVGYSVFMCLLFGITWWKPLRESQS